MPGTQNLQHLILNRKGARSYEDLSRDCGGAPTRKQLHRMATQEIKNFPDPETITRLARGLHILPSEVVFASAQSLGIDMGERDNSDLTLADAGTLPESSRQLLVSLSREMRQLHLSTATELPE